MLTTSLLHQFQAKFLYIHYTPAPLPFPQWDVLHPNKMNLFNIVWANPNEFLNNGVDPIDDGVR